ncbi:MAG: hypothetical protein IPF47_22685 [Gemmatimonadetes bacterium]|nr:hypothetical protein [Gemmatimonadota bacterium]
MSDSLSHPAFGTADLTNCERELIHLAGSIQPHGVLLVLAEGSLVIEQASANAPTLLGGTMSALLGTPLELVSAALAYAVRDGLSSDLVERPLPLRSRIDAPSGAIALEGCCTACRPTGSCSNWNVSSFRPATVTPAPFPASCRASSRASRPPVRSKGSARCWRASCARSSATIG